MEIIVEGTGKLKISPDEIKINFNYKVKADTYDKVLEQGASTVSNFINLLNNLGFKKDEIKTQSFYINEEQVYDEIRRKYVKDGYSFNQNLRLNIDYNMDKIAQIMTEISKLPIPPTYSIQFGVKENEKVKQQIIDLAYKDAYFYAQAIAQASDKTLKGCEKISFAPFEEQFVSPTRLDNSLTRAYAKASTESNIANSIVPEDITVEKTIHCIFKAEWVL